MGDYEISTNSLISGQSKSFGSNPVMSFGERSVRIKFKEYVGDVFTHPTVAGEFFQQQYALNPALLDNFPWLAPIAVQYQQWKPLGLLFEFISTSGEITNNQALGKVVMATDYNTTTLSTEFSNVSEMLAEAYAQESVPTSNMVHGIECDPRERTRQIYFTRSGAIPASASLGDFDLGQTTIATVGGPTANCNLGSLWIHYDIEFFKNELFAGVKNHDLVIRDWRATGGFVSSFGTTFSGLSKLYNGTGSYGAGSPRKGVQYEDFYWIPGGSQIQFPRYARVGTAWRIYVYVKGDTDTNSLQGIGFNAVVSGSIDIKHAITQPTTASTGRVSSGMYDFIIKKNTVAQPFVLEVQAGILPTGANIIYCTITSIPSYITNALG